MPHFLKKKPAVSKTSAAKTLLPKGNTSSPETGGDDRKRSAPFLTAVTAFAAGLLNGFLGTGGGAVLVLFLPSVTGLQKYRTALAAMLALTAISAGWFFAKHPESFSAVLPYLLPALLGGGCGALVLGKFGSALADRLFAVLTVIAGGILLLRG